MQAIRTHVAGVDVNKEILAITILTGDAAKEPVAEQFQLRSEIRKFHKIDESRAG